MNQLDYAGYFLIAGFALIILASITMPPRVFQGADSAQQIAVVESYPYRWVICNVFFALAGLVTAVGLALFSLSIMDQINPALNWLALLSYGLATVLWFIFIINRTLNPAQLFENYSFTLSTIALIGLYIISLVLYGFIYLQAGYPGWLGFGTAVLALLIGGSALFSPAQFFNSFPPQALYLFTLVAGIVLIKH